MQEKGPGIIGIGKYLPIEIRPNSYFSDILGLDTSDEWIYSHTGIKNRHIAAPHENTSDLATEAARAALKMAGLKPDDLDKIYLATATPDYSLFPPASSLVQTKLDKDKHTSAVYLGNACNGGLIGLEECYYMVQAKPGKTGIVIGAELLSRFMNYRDRKTCVLFGDGAGAAVVGEVFNPGPFAFVTGSDGSKADNIIYKGGGSVYPVTEKRINKKRFFTEMNGTAVYKDAVEAMTQMTLLALEEACVSQKDIDWWIPHQANLKIMKAAARRLGFQDRMISYIENIGNISAASIFVAMCEAFNDGLLQKGDIIAMAAIGSGYNFGGGVIQWQIENPTPRP